MGVKKTEWRESIVIDSKIKRKLLKSGVLNSLESCLEFLEELKQQGKMRTSELNVADEAYAHHLAEQLGKGDYLKEIQNRYYKMFRIPSNYPVLRLGEDFAGEFRYSHHIQHPAEYSSTGEETK